MLRPLKHRNRQSVDFVAFGMGPDEIHVGDLSPEMDHYDQPIVTARDLKPCTLSIQDHRMGRSLPDLIHRGNYILDSI
ncbi:hypothetical protein ACVMIH_007440 [Bradyrhizobium sp. USDA 4503]